MDHRTSGRRGNSCVESPNESVSPQHLNVAQEIPMLVTASAERRLYPGQDVASAIPSTRALPPPAGRHSDCNPPRGLPASEPCRPATLHPATTVVAQDRPEIDRLLNSLPVNPAISTPALAQLDRPTTCQRIIKQVDILTVDSTKPPDVSVLANTLAEDACQTASIREDKWRKYRGLRPSAKADSATPPATSTPRVTFSQTLVYTAPPVGRRGRPAPQHADVGLYKEAHQGLANQVIVERGQKNQCTACGELPFGDGKPNHRWFDCPGLPPQRPRVVPAVSMMGHPPGTKAQLADRPRPGPSLGVKVSMPPIMFPGMDPVHASTRENPQLPPLSASTPPDNASHLTALLNTIDALRNAPIMGRNRGASKVMPLAVSAPGEEKKPNIRAPSQDPSISNTTNTSKRRALTVPRGGNGHQRLASGTRNAASSTASSRQNMNGHHITRIEVPTRQAENAAIRRNQVQNEGRTVSDGPGSGTTELARHRKHMGKSHHSAVECLQPNDEWPSCKAQAQLHPEQRRAVTSVELEKQKIRESSLRTGATVPHEEQSRATQAPLHAGRNGDGKAPPTGHLQLSSFEYPGRPNQRRVAIGQPHLFSSTKLDIPGRLSLPANGSSMGHNQGHGNHGPGILVSTNGLQRRVPGITTEDGLQRESRSEADPSAACTGQNKSADALTRGSVAGFLAWFESAQGCPGGTTPNAWRTANIVNARNVIHREAINLQSIKGMSRREWKVLGVHSGIGAEISRKVEEYLTHL